MSSSVVPRADYETLEAEVTRLRVHNADLYTQLNQLQQHNQALREQVALLEQKGDLLQQQLGQLHEQQAHLRHELAQRKRHQYGQKSERRKKPSPQATLNPTSTPDSSKPVRQDLPERLPRHEVVIEPEEDTTKLRSIGQEVTETLHYVPGQLVVLRRVRPKYVDPTNPDRGVIIAPLPDRPIGKGLAEASLLAQIVVEKYLDHLPLYRQQQRFKREGIALPPSTLEGWVAQVGALLEPLYQSLCDEVRHSGYLQADETTIPVLDKSKKGQSHRGYYWVYHAPESGLVAVEYQRSRSAAGPQSFLQGYEGALQSDGYAAYDGFDTEETITHYGCWAHARRGFYEAQQNEPERAEHVLAQISQLYQIERGLREAEASPGQRRPERRARSVPLLEQIKTYLEAHPGLPKSPWGKAVRYTLKRWDKLTGYVEDGRIEIDNNGVENAIRPIALGRKNYLFAGSHEAAQRSAVLYSLLGTCKKQGVNPQVWLSDVLSRIACYPVKQVRELLPHRWTAASEDTE